MIESHAANNVSAETWTKVLNAFTVRSCGVAVFLLKCMNTVKHW